MPALHSRPGAITKLIVSTFVAGSLFSSNCSSRDVSAVVAGVDAIANYLDHDRSGRNDDDINFGDWLLDELNDL